MSDEPKEREMNPEDMFWSMYLMDAKEEDKYLPKSWEANTGSVLTFTGLFAATVAAFIIESYKSLSPDSGDQTVALLTQLLAATASSNASTPINPTRPVILSSDSFSARPEVMVVNVLWFSSLIIALFCALLSTLIQEWSRDYVRDINRRRTLDESVRNRAFNHIYIRLGVERYEMDSVVYCVTALVHLTVLLFVIGLIIFLFPIDDIVAGATAGVLGFFLLLYFSASISPLIDSSSPYRTPATYIFAGGYFLLLAAMRAIVNCGRWFDLDFMQSRERTAISTFHELMSRTVSEYDEFLAFGNRLVFAWNRTSRHMLSGHLDQLMQVLYSIVSDIESRRGPEAKLELSEVLQTRSVTAPLDCISSDEAFVEAIGLKVRRALQLKSTQMLDTVLFQTIGILSLRMFASNRIRSTGDIRVSLPICKYLLVSGRLALLVHSERTNVIDKIQAHMTLAVVRRSLVDLCIDIRRGQVLPTLTQNDVEDILTPFNKDGYRSSTGDVHPLNGRTLDPRAFLLIMQYHVRRAEAPWSSDRWLDSTESCWIPLHDGDCCQSWRSVLTADGWAHDAASGLLSTISHYLDSPEDDRQSGLDALYLFSWRSSEIWDNSDHLEEYLSLGPPSDAFIALLRKSGLEEWLQPGSNHVSFPVPDGNGIDELQGALNCLRTLARFVDWEAFHQGQNKPKSEISLAPCDCNEASHCAGPRFSMVDLSPDILKHHIAPATTAGSRLDDRDIQSGIGDAATLQTITIERDHSEDVGLGTSRFMSIQSPQDLDEGMADEIGARER